jgi:hypothetical protein
MARGCWYWLCKCFYDEEETGDDNHINNGQRNVVNPSQNRNVLTVGNDEQQFQQRYEQVWSKFKIQTNIDKIKIIGKDEYDKTENVKYNCPICLKYYNHILKLSCCQNYICQFCSEDYITTNIKYNFVLNCPFCGVIDKTIILNDAKLDDSIKNYSNSPIKKMKSDKNIAQIIDMNEDSHVEDNTYKNTEKIDNDINN